MTTVKIVTILTKKRYSRTEVPGADIAALLGCKTKRGGDKRESHRKQEAVFGLGSGVQDCPPGFATDSGKVGLEGCMMMVISYPCELKNSDFESLALFKRAGEECRDCLRSESL